MRVIYVEDDVIDQLAFKRYADQLNIEYTIVSNVKDAKTHLNQCQFDLALLDFNLSDGTACDLLNDLSNIPVIIFCEPSKVPSALITERLFFEEKPLKANLLQQFCGQPLDLSYFNELTESDQEFKIEMVNMSITAIQDSVLKLKLAIESNNMEQLKFELHKMKSPFRVFKLPSLDVINFVEVGIQTLSTSEIVEQVELIEASAKKSVVSLNLLLQKLKNI